MQNLLLKAIQTTILAAKPVMNFYKHNFEIYIKKDHSPVTEADLAAHDIFMQELSPLQIPILSEEGEHYTYEERKSWQKYWVIDPVDGTRDFIHKTDEFCICLGLIENGKPILGVLYAPALNKLYFGAKDFGAYLVNFSLEEDINNLSLEDWKKRAKKLPISPKNNEYIFLSSVSHRDKETQILIQEALKNIPNGKVINVGSALKIGMIAEGLANKYFRLSSLFEWDLAAGHAIVEAAGLTVKNVKTGKEISYQNENMKVAGFSIVNDL